MSKLELVAIQFGVKFAVIYNLPHYVDKVCQQYLHYFMCFENFVTFTKYLIILSLFYLSSRSFYIIPYMDSQPWKAILNQEEFAAILLVGRIWGGRRGLQPYHHPLKTFKYLMSVKKHLK